MMKKKHTRTLHANNLVRWLFIVLWSLTPCISYTQNFVPNPSFEDFVNCPNALGQLGPMECVPWVSVSGTADFFHECSSPVWCGVPNNFQGHQPTVTGAAYAGAYARTFSGASREYVQARLLDTLEADVCYKISAWINLCDECCAADQYGILLTESAAAFPIGSFPQVSWNGQFISDSVGWTHLLGYYTAIGNEEYITIGNFRLDSETQMDPACIGPAAIAYYYIDEVSIIEVEPEQIDVDLGGPVMACDSFIIDPGGDPDVVYVWNTGHQGQTLTVYTSGTYSVTASYNCMEAVGDIDVTIIASEILEIGPDTVMICSGESYEIQLDPALGSYEWQDGSSATDYSITTEGLYHVTVDNGCNVSSDSVMVSVLAPPATFTLGPDTILCEGDELVITLDPSLGNFLWHDNSTSPTYTIDDEGVYALSISNACGEETDEFEITSLEIPMIFIGPDTVHLCDNEDWIIDFDPDLGDFIWQDNSTSSSYIIFNAGVYSVTVSNVCGGTSDEIIATQHATPDFDFGPDQQGCPGDIFELDASGNVGTYIWHDGSNTPTYIVTTSGTYSLTISNPCGIAIDEFNALYVPDVIPPDLGPDLTLCPGEQIVLHVDSPGASYLWSDMSTADSLIINESGSYFVEVSNQCGEASDTVNISFNSDPPALQLPPDFALCEGQTFTLDPGLSGVNYLWSDGSVMPTLQITTSGTYSLTVSNNCGMSVDTVIVSAGDPLPVVDLGVDTSLCSGDTIVVVPDFSNVTSWTWSDGTNAPVYTATTIGTISIEVENACASAYDTLVVSLLPGIPPLLLGSDTAICPGQMIAFNIGIADVDILWSDGSTGSTMMVADSGIIHATITNVCGSSSDSVSVSVLPDIPSLDLGPDQTICPGELVTISVGVSGVSYEWHDGSTDAEFQTNIGGTIILTITNACGTTSDTLILTESTQGPQVDLGPDIERCANDTALIEAGISGVQYLWQDGSTQDELLVTQSGIYSLTVTNACGVDTDAIEVVFIDLPPVQSLGADTILCEGQTIVLAAQSSPGVMIQWQDMAPASTYIVTQPGNYYVTAFNQCAESSDTVVVTYKDAPDPFSIGPDTTICPGENITLLTPVHSFEVLWQDGSNMPEQVVSQAGTYWLQLSNECGITSDTMEVNFDMDVPNISLPTEISWCPGDQIILDASQAFEATYVWNIGSDSPTITVSAPGTYIVEVATKCHMATDQSIVMEEEDCPMGPIFYIPNVFSPNDDGINDVFTVSADMPENVLAIEGRIFDRWGNLVFGSTENPFAWDGTFESTTLNPGVYVYAIKIRYMAIGNEREDVFTGSVTLVR